MAWAPDYVLLADLKDFLRIDTLDTDDDTQLALDITTSSRSVDAHCNRQFGSATGVERHYTGFWRDCSGSELLYIFPIDDLMTTVGLTVVADDVTLTSDDYDLLPLNAVANGKPWTHIALTSYAARLDITATWGWTAVPSSVKKATLLQASRIFNRRNSPYGVAGSPDVGSELRLLAKVDPDVAVSLKGFSRLRSV